MKANIKNTNILTKQTTSPLTSAIKPASMVLPVMLYLGLFIIWLALQSHG